MDSTPSKVLAKCHNIDDLRSLAQRKVPKLLFDFMDGGAEDEVALRRSRSGFDRYQLVPHNFVDVSKINISTEVMGRKIDAPLIVSPTGLPKLFHHTGEESLVPAAGKHNIPYTLSSASSTSIEGVGNLSSGPKWFQIYVWKDRAIVRDFIERCKGAGFSALCLTIDVPITGNRERDVRNGLAMPLKMTPTIAFDMLRKPAWLYNALTHPLPTLANLVDRVEGDTSAADLSHDPLILPMSRADIADYLGLTIETVSRTFTRLKTDKLISLPEHNQVEVNDMPELRRLAEG